MPEEKRKETAPYILDARKKNLSHKQVVERILSENRITAAPIPVVSIAESMGFSVYFATFNDQNIAGIMFDAEKPWGPFEDNRVIAINRKDYATRQNFTVAHEVGHFVLHCSQDNNFYERYMHGLDRGQKEKTEKEANSFAAELLMPESMVRSFLNTLPEQITRAQAALEISRKFIVSTKAAHLRMDELGI